MYATRFPRACVYRARVKARALAAIAVAVLLLLDESFWDKGMGGVFIFEIKIQKNTNISSYSRKQLFDNAYNVL